MQSKNVLARNEWVKVETVRKWRRGKVAITKDGRVGEVGEGSEVKGSCGRKMTWR